MESKQFEEELELIKKARNSETIVLEASPPTPPNYGYGFEEETREVLEDPEIKTVSNLEHSLFCRLDKHSVEVRIKVFKVGQATPPIENVDDSQGYQKTAKVRIGDLIIMYDWRYIGT